MRAAIKPLMGPLQELTPGHLADMNFLVTFKAAGFARSRKHSKLLRQAGFRLEKTLLTKSEVSVLETFAV